MTFIDQATETLPHHITTPAGLARVAVAPAPLLDVTIPGSTTRSGTWKNACAACTRI